MSSTWKEAISTPALIVDYEILIQNINYMAQFAKKNGIALRPHVKTHKCPKIAHLQLKAGAKGICVAKVSEAEVFAASGLTDILIANEIISPEKIQRLINLNRYSQTMVAVDSRKNIEVLNQMASKSGITLKVLIDLNIGLNRTGIQPGIPALELAQVIEKSSHLQLEGLQAYEGHLTYIKDFSQKTQQVHLCMKRTVETKELIEDNGILCPTITAGGSGTFMITGKYPSITEIQPGTYVFNDHHIHSVVPELTISLTVLTTVNNKPTKGIMTLDMGSKSISSDMGDPQFKGFGKKLKVLALTEEHCQCTYPSRFSFELGDKIEAIPAHVCPTVNLYDFLYVIKGDELIGKWPILARGMRE
ncbi:MAG: DSD1 family PLP-dependent enzyme [Candidatus Helarchaeota archaeon]